MLNPKCKMAIATGRVAGSDSRSKSHILDVNLQKENGPHGAVLCDTIRTTVRADSICADSIRAEYNLRRDLRSNHSGFCSTATSAVPGSFSETTSSELIAAALPFSLRRK